MTSILNIQYLSLLVLNLKYIQYYIFCFGNQKLLRENLNSKMYYLHKFQMLNHFWKPEDFYKNIFRKIHVFPSYINFTKMSCTLHGKYY